MKLGSIITVVIVSALSSMASIAVWSHYNPPEGQEWEPTVRQHPIQMVCYYGGDKSPTSIDAMSISINQAMSEPRARLGFSPVVNPTIIAAPAVPTQTPLPDALCGITSKVVSP